MATLRAMDKLHRRLQDINQDVLGTLERLSFEVTATQREHTQLLAALRGAPEVGELLTFRVADED
jgi:hypothetical protein